MLLNAERRELLMKHVVALARGKTVEDSVSSVLNILHASVRGRVCVLASRDVRRGFLAAVVAALKNAKLVVLVSNRGVDQADYVIRLTGLENSITNEADFWIVDCADLDNLVLAARNVESTEVVRRAICKMVSGVKGSVWYGLTRVKRISDICLETRNVPEAPTILACLQKSELVFFAQTKALKVQMITAQRNPSEWRPDSKGYLLIKLENEKIVVGHCTSNHVLTTEITGYDPLDLYYTIIRLDLVSSLQHAAYLGVELQRAYEALRTGKEYLQDADMV